MSFPFYAKLAQESKINYPSGSGAQDSKKCYSLISEKWKVYSGILDKLPAIHIEMLYILILHHYCQTNDNGKKKTPISGVKGKKNIPYSGKILNRAKRDTSGGKHKTEEGKLPDQKAILGKGALYHTRDLPSSLQKILLTYLDQTIILKSHKSTDK
jgi:hypothetical protein